MNIRKSLSHANRANKETRARKLRDAAVSPTYPFSALVGQEEMKLALILSVIEPAIGGVLIMGHRGTGKSTAVRALADLLPRISIVLDCQYQCDPHDEGSLCNECSIKVMSGARLQRKEVPIPLVDLPLGATEDRVCGTIDIERALKDGVKSFEPGLLARANRGFLYIDEVNLLEDHLVDLLLDVAAFGRNKVERESISIEHPARFVLVGSGNPEEGELRPQLLDRFGLHVDVKTADDPDSRIEIIEQREAFERDPEMFRASFAQDEQKLRNKIIRAQKNVRAVKLDRQLLRRIAQLCTELKVDGHRGELTITKAGRALAAFEGRRKVTTDDLRRVAGMSLRHRLRRDALEETASTEQIQQALDRVLSQELKRSGTRWDGNGGADGINGDEKNKLSERNDSEGARGNRRSASPGGRIGTDSPGRPSATTTSDTRLPHISSDNRVRIKPRPSGSSQKRGQTGVRSTTLNYERGRYSKSVVFRHTAARVAIDATLRAMAGVGYRVSRGGRLFLPTPGTRRPVPADALRYKQLSQKRGTLYIFAIDTSGSMALNRIRRAKDAALGLLKRSYIRRDSVAIIGFRGLSANILLPPTRSILRARRTLDSLKVGGGTPLSAGLLRALELAQRSGRSENEVVLLIFTDGHANVSVGNNAEAPRAQRQATIERELVSLGLELRKAGVKTLVVDTQNGFLPNGDARALAGKLGASYEHLTNRLLHKKYVFNESAQRTAGNSPAINRWD